MSAFGYQVPESLNGYPVIRQRAHANGYATIMVERADMHDRFVVATWHTGLERGWVWGHYWDARGDADASFGEVDKRNLRR